MADIVLKNRTGTDVTYEGIQEIELNKSGSGTQKFQAGELATKTVAANFGNGDQVINASSGELLTSVTVEAPSTLLPENVKDGVTIAGVTGTLSGGAGGEKDVVFLDYDGTVVESYTKEEFALLEAMPSNPSHTGLTAQGWNWTLADAQQYVANYGMIAIGQQYITSDGKTRVHIHLDVGRLEPYLGLAINGSVTIEWGDGTSDDVTGSSDTTVYSTKHVYTESGDYVVVITVNSGYAVIRGKGNFSYYSNTGYETLLYNAHPYNYSNPHYDSNYRAAVKKVEIGSNMRIGTGAFYQLALESVNIPIGSWIGAGFVGLNNLKAFILPQGTTYVGSYLYATNAKYISLPNTITSINESAFRGNACFEKVALPDSITSLYYAKNLFYECTSLKKIIIPDSVTALGSEAMFSNCSKLEDIYISSNVTEYPYSLFAYCKSLKVADMSAITTMGQGVYNSCTSLTAIIWPENISAIPSNFMSFCYMKNDPNIPNTVTAINRYGFHSNSFTTIKLPDNLVTIGDDAFEYCTNLVNIEFPATVETIGNSAFYNCSCLGEIRFNRVVPAALGSSYTFQGIGSYDAGCKIYVPFAGLADYLAAPNYPSATSTAYNYTYIGFATYASGDPLPATDSTGMYIATWYATKANAIAETNPITVGNGEEIYCRYIARTRVNRYTSSVGEVQSGTTLTQSVNATVGDLVIATFVVRSNTYTLSNGWTEIGVSNTVGTLNQRTGLAYKIAESTTESLTVTQDTAGRLYINMVAITGASLGTFSGFSTADIGESITVTKPSGLVVWGVSSSYWGTSTPYQLWGVSNTDETIAIQLPNTTQPRCLTLLDYSDDASMTFTYSPGQVGNGEIAAANVTITGIPDFWYYV